MTLQITNRIEDIRKYVADWRTAGLRIGFVPTMGNLHEGHMDLFRTIQPHCDKVVYSIFANPLQFGPNDDYDKYPRTWEDDVAKLERIGAHALFAPSVEEMYGSYGMSETKVSVKRLNNQYCGATRTEHFIGVATVVCKLFNIVSPHIAVFGEKDFQQLAVIKQMVNDLSLPVEIIGSPTYRETSGLAYSSRNQYLTPEQRQEASLLYKVLSEVRREVIAGIRNWADLEADARKQLLKGGFEPEYFRIVSAETLENANEKDKRLVVLAAAHLGKARLIDNIQISR